MKITQEMKDAYNERLRKVIGTKIRTTMVYPISQFEGHFGHLWGHGKPYEALTNDEKMWRAKWDEVRDNIFTLGNAQRRNMETEVKNHDVVLKTFETVLLPVNKYKELTDEK